MAKLTRKNLGWFLGGILMSLIVGFCFANIFSTEAQEQIKIFPTVFSGDWQNPGAVFSQDLGENATFEEFNEENSAYPFASENKKENLEIPAKDQSKAQKLIGLLEKIKCFFKFNLAKAQETPSPENTLESTPEPTLEPTPESNSEPTPESTPAPEPTLQPTPETPAVEPREKVLELSNFSIPEVFSNKTIKNIQLRLSLAGKGEKGDKLIIDYYYQDSWQSLVEFDLENEISNALNGGYFLYALPVFENQKDLENLKIRFIYSGSQNSKVFLDSLWLEIDYEEFLFQTEVPPEEFVEESTPQPESQSEPTPPSPLLKERKLEKEIHIDAGARHSCIAKNFSLNLSGRERDIVEIEFTGMRSDLESLEIGSLPLGIDITFLNNADYSWSPAKSDSKAVLQIVNQPGSQKGNFSIPIIYTSGNSTTVCQINIINF
jgi:hypothetical protein